MKKILGIVIAALLLYCAEESLRKTWEAEQARKAREAAAAEAEG